MGASQLADLVAQSDGTLKELVQRSTTAQAMMIMDDIKNDTPGAKLFARLVGSGYKALQEHLVVLAVPSAILAQKKELLQWMAEAVMRCSLNDLLVRNIGPLLVHMMDLIGTDALTQALNLLREFLPIGAENNVKDDNQTNLLLPFVRVSQSSMSKELAMRFADYSHRRSASTMRTLDLIINLLIVLEPTESKRERVSAAVMSSGLRQFLYDCKDIFHNIKVASPLSLRRRTLASLCHVIALIGDTVFSYHAEVRVQEMSGGGLADIKALRMKWWCGARMVERMVERMVGRVVERVVERAG